MADTAHGDIVYPLGGDDFSVPTAMLAMANSLDPRVIGQYTSKATRNSATSALTAAGKRVVAWVDGVGLCAHNGTTWKNLSPPDDYVFARNYGAGQRVDPGQSWIDPTAAGTITGVVTGQVLNIQVYASIRVDGNDLRQSLQLSADVTGAALTLSQLAPEMARQPATMTTFDEYETHTSRARFLTSSGTVTIKVALAAGAGAPDLVMQQAQIFVTLYPVDAA